MTAPSRIGRYEIVRRLGKSMTDVYLAIDTVENRKAALKLIQVGRRSRQRSWCSKPSAAAPPSRRNCTRSIRAWWRSTISATLDGYFFVAMQYVEGRNLAEVLRRESAIDPIRAATIALEICEQLAKFHSLASGGGARRHQALEHPPGAATTPCGCSISASPRRCAPDRDATMHNFGSPGYCSPERLTRSEVDQQSDLWAVGATLYEMLAGVPPYPGREHAQAGDA